MTEVFPAETFQETVWPIVQKLAKIPPNSMKFSKGLIVDGEREILHEVSY